jgi:hypothetical protein
MAVTLSPNLRQRYLDANGNPLAGGKLYTYQAGTSTPQATYTDSTGGTPNTNPVILDANGEASVWLDQSLSYKFILTDSLDVSQWTVDGVVGLVTAGAVVTASLADGSVTTVKMADNAVTAAKLASSATVDATRAVTADHVRDGAITSGKLNASAADGSTLEVATGQMRLKDKGVTIAKMADMPIAATAAAGGLAMSAAFAWSGTTIGTDEDVTGATVTLPTTGRPVFIGLIGGPITADPDKLHSYIGFTGGAANSVTWEFSILEGATVIANYRHTAYSNDLASLPLSSINTRIAATAGSHTYKLHAKHISGLGTISIVNAAMIAYEM